MQKITIKKQKVKNNEQERSLQQFKKERAKKKK